LKMVVRLIVDCPERTVDEDAKELVDSAIEAVSVKVDEAVQWMGKPIRESVLAVWGKESVVSWEVTDGSLVVYVLLVCENGWVAEGVN
jgi:hypothetical protein